MCASSGVVRGVGPTMAQQSARRDLRERQPIAFETKGTVREARGSPRGRRPSRSGSRTATLMSPMTRARAPALSSARAASRSVLAERVGRSAHAASPSGRRLLDVLHHAPTTTRRRRRPRPRRSRSRPREFIDEDRVRGRPARPRACTRGGLGSYTSASPPRARTTAGRAPGTRLTTRSPAPPRVSAPWRPRPAQPELGDELVKRGVLGASMASGEVRDRDARSRRARELERRLAPNGRRRRAALLSTM